MRERISSMLNRDFFRQARSSSNAASVLGARTPKLLNLMWPVLGEGGFTHYFGGEGQVLDQLIVDSRTLRRGGPRGRSTSRGTRIISR